MKVVYYVLLFDNPPHGSHYLTKADNDWYEKLFITARPSESIWFVPGTVNPNE